MKSCLCIGGPKDGQWISVEDRFKRGDNYRVVLAPKLDVPRVMTEDATIDMVQYDSFIYTIDLVRAEYLSSGERSEWWYMRPYGQTIAHTVAMLFANYQPKHPRHEDA